MLLGRLSYSRLFVAYWALYACFQLAAVGTRRLDYYDSFDYLRSARSLAGSPISYSFRRAPGVPLLHAPGQRVMDLLGVSDRARLLWPHFLHAAASGLLLLVFYRGLRPLVGSAWAQAGTLALSLNRLTLHYFVSVMADIPAALFLSLFGSWVLASRSRAARVLAGASLAACLLCRWNMPLVVALIVLLAAARMSQGSEGLKWGRHFLAAAAMGAAFFLIALLAFYRALTPLDWAGCARLYATVLASNAADAGTAEPAWEYAASIWTSAGPFVSMLFGFGLVDAWRKKNATSALHGAFFLAFAAAMALAVGHKESRFLIPVLPSFYIVALFGAKSAAAWAQRRPRLKTCGTAALTLSLLWGGVRELQGLLDPVYRSPLLLDTAAALRAYAAPKGKLFWAGSAYSSVPREFRFASGDDSYSLYHVPSRQSTAYLAGVEPILAGHATPAPGDLLIEAPPKIFLLDAPLSENENRLRLWRFDGDWKLLTALR